MFNVLEPPQQDPFKLYPYNKINTNPLQQEIKIKNLRLGSLIILEMHTIHISPLCQAMQCVSILLTISFTTGMPTTQ